jgi:hypothetical protein
MFVIYDEIRLDPSAKSISACEAEWAINPKRWIMQHEPSETVFRISVDRMPNEGDPPLTLMDFSSTLMAIGEDCTLPRPEDIETLGRAAIVLYLKATGNLPTSVSSEADTSEETPKTAYVC